MPLKTPELTKFTTASQRLATYDWEDLANGIGYRNFYPCETENGKILVTTTSVYATNDKRYTRTDIGAYDEDFDIVLGKPLTIDGDVLVTIPAYFKNNSGGTITVTTDATFKIRKWDGTTETDLATGTATIAKSIPATSISDGIWSFSLTIDNVHFSAGETLRFSISGTDANDHLFLYRDPAATAPDISTSELATTRMTLAVPIKIED